MMKGRRLGDDRRQGPDKPDKSNSHNDEQAVPPSCAVAPWIVCGRHDASFASEDIKSSAT